MIILVVACGESDIDRAAGAGACVPAADVEATGAGGDGASVAVAARDDRFDPACLEVDAPGQVSIVLRNEGRHPHNLTTDDDRAVSVDAGQVAILAVDVPRRGLHFVCTIHPGMEGEFRVAP